MAHTHAVMSNDSTEDINPWCMCFRCDKDQDMSCRNIGCGGMDSCCLFGYQCCGYSCCYPVRLLCYDDAKLCYEHECFNSCCKMTKYDEKDGCATKCWQGFCVRPCACAHIFGFDPITQKTRCGSITREECWGPILLRDIYPYCLFMNMYNRAKNNEFHLLHTKERISVIDFCAPQKCCPFYCDCTSWDTNCCYNSFCGCVPLYRSIVYTQLHKNHEDKDAFKFKGCKNFWDDFFCSNGCSDSVKTCRTCCMFSSYNYMTIELIDKIRADGGDTYWDDPTKTVAATKYDKLDINFNF